MNRRIRSFSIGRHQQQFKQQQHLLLLLLLVILLLLQMLPFACIVQSFHWGLPRWIPTRRKLHNYFQFPRVSKMALHLLPVHHVNKHQYAWIIQLHHRRNHLYRTVLSRTVQSSLLYDTTTSTRSATSSNLDDLLNEIVSSDQSDPLFQQPQQQQRQDESLSDNSSSSPSSIYTITRNGWKTINWDAITSMSSTLTISSSSSPVDIVYIRDKVVYLKRDDLIRLSGSQLSGNKARKLLLLHNLITTGQKDFPKCIVSYGGSQSNSMLAIAALVHYQNTISISTDTTTTTAAATATLENHMNDDETSRDTATSSTINNDGNTSNRYRFVYYTKKLPRFLRDQPSGNFFRALSLGMEVHEVTDDEYNILIEQQQQQSVSSSSGPSSLSILQPPVPNDTLWIPQGGSSSLAIPGCTQLAYEIYTYWDGFCRSQTTNRPLTVYIPGGTCTTALLVHRALQHFINNNNGDDNNNTDTDHRNKTNTATTTTTVRRPKLDIEVVVIPCVGDDAYARRQMISLSNQIQQQRQQFQSSTMISTSTKTTDATIQSGNNECHGDDDTTKTTSISIPYILPAAPGGRYGEVPTTASYFGRSAKSSLSYFRFGDPSIELLNTYRELNDKYNIVVDLIYGAPSWTILFRHWTTLSSYPLSLLSRLSTTPPRTIPPPPLVPSQQQQQQQQPQPVSFINPVSTTTNTSTLFDCANVSEINDNYYDKSNSNFTNNNNNNSGRTERQIMYVHSGGLEGINSQLLRYKYKDLVSLHEIQLPNK